MVSQWSLSLTLSLSLSIITHAHTSSLCLFSLGVCMCACVPGCVGACVVSPFRPHLSTHAVCVIGDFLLFSCLLHILFLFRHRYCFCCPSAALGIPGLGPFPQIQMTFPLSVPVSRERLLCLQSDQAFSLVPLLLGLLLSTQYRNALVIPPLIKVGYVLILPSLPRKVKHWLPRLPTPENLPSLSASFLFSIPYLFFFPSLFILPASSQDHTETGQVLTCLIRTL